MSKNLREALREKHRTEDGISCRTCLRLVDGSLSGTTAPGAAIPKLYPCDVVKLLDAVEAELEGAE